jgi:Mor family transcriptional regulator
MNSGSNLKSKGPEFLLDLVHHTAGVLRKAGMSSDSAQDLAVAVATRVAEQWGGHGIYFPKGTWNGRAALCFKLEERDWKIYREYDGTNRHEVCARHDISPSRLYQIIAAIRRHRSTQPLPLIHQNTAIDR